MPDGTDEFGEVAVDDPEGCDGHGRAFPTSTSGILQSPRFRRGWTFSDGQDCYASVALLQSLALAF